MKKHTLATLAALMAAISSAYADDTNYWGAPQTSNGSVNITNYWGIAPAGDASSGGSNSNTDWINAQPDATGASAQNDDWLAAGGQSDDGLLKVSTRAASSDLTRASSADTPALTRAASGKAAGTDATDATGGDAPSNATWVQTYPEPDNATWVKTYPDSDETASVDINGNADGSASRTVGSIDASVPTCLDINGSEYCTGGSNADNTNTNGTPLMRSALKVDTSELTGDEKLACEAILCLSASAAAGGECQPSLSRYFSITLKTAARTARARGDFLKMCPKVENDEQMQTQIAAITEGDTGSMSWDDYTSRHGSDTSLAKGNLPCTIAEDGGLRGTCLEDSQPVQTASNESALCTEAETGTRNARGEVCNGVFWTGDPHWNQAPLNTYCLFGSQRCIYSEAELAQSGMEGWVLVNGRYVPPTDPDAIAANGDGSNALSSKKSQPENAAADTDAAPTYADGAPLKTIQPVEIAQPEVQQQPDNGMSIEQARTILIVQRIAQNSGEAHRGEETPLTRAAREVLQNASGAEADAAKHTLQVNGVVLP